jgi:hypothetical protein
MWMRAVPNGRWTGTHWTHGSDWTDGYDGVDGIHRSHGSHVGWNECGELGPGGRDDLDGPHDLEAPNDLDGPHDLDASSAELRAPYIHRLRQYAIFRLHEFVQHHTDDQRATPV